MTNDNIKKDDVLHHWPTKVSDMHLAENIIAYYKVATPQGRLFFFDIVLPQSGESAVRVKLPIWIVELANALKAVHGEFAYPFVVTHVIDEVIDNHFHTLTESQVRLLKMAITAYFHAPVDIEERYKRH